MPKPIENGQKPLENVFRTPTDCRFWETTAIATHENKERLMYSKGLLLNQIEQMRSYRTFPLVGPTGKPQLLEHPTPQRAKPSGRQTRDIVLTKRVRSQLGTQ